MSYLVWSVRNLSLLEPAYRANLSQNSRPARNNKEPRYAAAAR